MELKPIHTDLFIQKELPVLTEISKEELEDFRASVFELEENWPMKRKACGEEISTLAQFAWY